MEQKARAKTRGARARRRTGYESSSDCVQKRITENSRPEDDGVRGTGPRSSHVLRPTMSSSIALGGSSRARKTLQLRTRSIK